MKRSRRQTGFTMVELVTCIVILGILSVVAAPKLLGNNTLDTRTYSYEIAAALREAQTIAAASGCDVALTFSAGSYVAQQRSATANHCNPGGSWTVNVLRADGSALAGIAPGSITLAPAVRIVFDARGHVASAMPPLLSIGTYRLSIDPLSGFVTLQ